MMTNGDPEGRIFLSYPHTHNGFFFLLFTAVLFENKLPEVPEYAKMQFHIMTSLKLNNDVYMTTMCVSSKTTNVCCPHVTAWVR